MCYLRSILKVAGRLAARVAMCFLLVLLSVVLLTACSEKKKEKEVEIVPEGEDTVADKIKKHMDDIEKAAADEEEESRSGGDGLDFIGGLGSLGGSGFPSGVQ